MRETNAVKATTRHACEKIGEKHMGNETAPTEAGLQYAAAQAAHYETKDLHEALGLYKAVMAAHPDAQEAEYSRTQIQNIVKRVVPQDALFDAQMELAMAHFKHLGLSDVKPEPGTSP